MRPRSLDTEFALWAMNHSIRLAPVYPPESLKSRGAMNGTASTIEAQLDMIRTRLSGFIGVLSAGLNTVRPAFKSGVQGVENVLQCAWAIGVLRSRQPVL